MKRLPIQVVVLVWSVFSLFCLHPVHTLAEDGYVDEMFHDPQTDPEGHEEREVTPAEEEQGAVSEGEEQHNEAIGAEGGPTNIFLTLLKVIFGLLIVIVLIYAVVKFLSSRQRQLGQARLLHHVAGLSLGPQKSIQLVKMGSTYYLIGVGDNISLMKEITDRQEIERIEHDLAEQESVVTQNLRSFIQSKFHFRKSPEDENLTFQSLLNQSMEKQRKKRADMEEYLQLASERGEEGRYK